MKLTLIIPSLSSILLITKLLISLGKISFVLPPRAFFIISCFNSSSDLFKTQSEAKESKVALTGDVDVKRRI